MATATKRRKRTENLFSLSDAELAALLHQAQLEAERRTAAAVRDAGLIIKGNELAKRAVTVAAAGGHSLLLVGPPGCGKTMLRAMAHELGLSRTFEAHPCPCGYQSDPRSACSCTAEEIEPHRRTWPMGTWPVAEMFVEVVTPTGREMASSLPGTSLADIRRHIESMSGPVPLDLCEHSTRLLKCAVAELGLSAEQRQTTIRIAATIARLDGAANIGICHISEAINYRLPRSQS